MWVGTPADMRHLDTTVVVVLTDVHRTFQAGLVARKVDFHELDDQGPYQGYVNFTNLTSTGPVVGCFMEYLRHEETRRNCVLRIGMPCSNVTVDIQAPRLTFASGFISADDMRVIEQCQLVHASERVTTFRKF